MTLALFVAFGLFATSAGADDVGDNDTNDAGTNPDLFGNPGLETDQPDLVPDDTAEERD